jgi:hypothetical protein
MGPRSPVCERWWRTRALRPPASCDNYPGTGGDRAVVVWDKGEGKTVSGGKRTARIADIDAERLILKLEFSPQILAYVPLTFVAAVWLDENDQANIDVNGALKGALSSSGPRFVPPGSVA